MEMNCGGVIDQNQIIGFKHSVRRFARSSGRFVVPAALTPRAAGRERLSCHSAALVGIYFGAVPVAVRASTVVSVADALPQQAATQTRARLTTRCSRRGPRSRSEDGRRRGVARAAERER